MDFMAMLKQEKEKLKKQATSKNEQKSETTPSSIPEVPFPEFADLDSTRTVERLDLEQFRVNSSLRDVYYIPDYISEDEHVRMMEQVYSPAAKWVNLKCRNLQSYGGKPGPHMVPEKLPPWLDALARSLVKVGIFDEEDAPNHVLLNEYKAGQGIMAHSDGPIYKPLVACLSLGSPCVINFTPRVSSELLGVKPSSSDSCCALVLKPRSLLVFRGDAYTNSLHGINDSFGDTVPDGVANAELVGMTPGDVVQRGTRVSLTVRHVLLSEK